MKLPFDLKDIKPGEFSYLTKRKLENDGGEETGEIFIWQKSGEEEYNYILHCPYCGVEGGGSVVFTRRPYRVRCQKCEKSILIKRLKDEAKTK